MRTAMIVLSFVSMIPGGISAAGQDTGVTDGRYFGSPEPGPRAEPFAVEVLSSSADNYIRSITFSPDGLEAYWPVIDTTDGFKRWIVTSRMKDGAWTSPETAPFSSKDFYDDVPFLSPGGRRMVFVSARPLSAGGKVEKERLWVMDRNPTGWSPPAPLPDTVNSGFTIHQQASIDGRGDIYFGGEGPGGQGDLDICVSSFREGEYLPPENLGPVINGPSADYSPSISPDGSFLIYTRNLEEGWTLMLSFRDDEGGWTEPVDLRGLIEGTRDMHLSGACLTAGARQLIFFGGRGDSNSPYWTDASFIEELRPGGDQ